MTRMDSVRAATGTAKDSVRHAAEVVAPYAEYGQGRAPRTTRTRPAYGWRPRWPQAAAPGTRAVRRPSRTRVSSRPVARCRPRSTQAATTRPPCRTRKAARQAADYTAPRIEHAVTQPAAAEPVREEARRPQCRRARRTARPGDGRGDRRSWSAEARAAGQVRPARQAPRRAGHPGRRRRRRLEVVGQAGQPGLAGRAAGRHRGQRPRPADVGRRQRGRLLDPEVQAKQAEAEATNAAAAPRPDRGPPAPSPGRARTPTRGDGHGPVA